MVGAGGFEPPTPRPPEKRQAAWVDTTARDDASTPTSTRTTLHEDPPGKLDMGQSFAARTTSRLALIRAFAAAIVRAVSTGDLTAARVSHEALGKLLEAPSPARSEAKVALARTRRSRR
jgi:hypothetical protein